VSSTFVILTHVRSGSSMLGDMLTRNGIGASEEHLNLRFLGEDTPWTPAGVLAEARERTPGPYFGTKVMVHWLDTLKKRAGRPATSDVELLEGLCGNDFTMIHLYRQDTVAAAVSFVRARFDKQWSRRAGESSMTADLPAWEAIDALITEAVSWLDWCKHRLRMAASLRRHGVVEVCYEDLERDPGAELFRVVAEIQGAGAAPVRAVTDMVRMRDDESGRLRERWLAEHPGYAAYSSR
jgi:LPS sulfotransferase NodH